MDFDGVGVDGGAAETEGSFPGAETVQVRIPIEEEVEGEEDPVTGMGCEGA